MLEMCGLFKRGLEMRHAEWEMLRQGFDIAGGGVEVVGCRIGVVCCIWCSKRAGEVFENWLEAIVFVEAAKGARCQLL